MRRPLWPAAPSLSGSAGRPRNGPLLRPELPPSQETGEVRSQADFIVLVNLQLPRERERRIS